MCIRDSLYLAVFLHQLLCDVTLLVESRKETAHGSLEIAPTRRTQIMNQETTSASTQSRLDPSDEKVISIKGMHKWFGDFHVLKDIDLQVARSERIVICGPSGSGKSTLIRCINRLEEHQQGSIVVDGTELTPVSYTHLTLPTKA